MSGGRRRSDVRKTLVYLELVAPLLDDPESRNKWLFWLYRDVPWTMDEGWSIEYWGLRETRDRTSSWNQLRLRGPRLPFRRAPRAIIAFLAWSWHFALALARPSSTILLARSPYLGFGAALARLLRRRPPRLVVRIVERMPSTARDQYGASLVARVLEGMEQFVLRRADLVVPIAGFTRGVAERAGVPEERILELPNPPRWGSTEVPEAAGERPPRVVCAARLNRGKGVDLLIRAFAAVAKDFPQAVLEIAGDGREREPLEALAGQHGLGERVRFRGWLPAYDMPAFFGSALVAVLPSRVEEGHPMALREAALAGCALVGTDLGGIRDIVVPGRTGYLVPPGNVEALAEALRACLKDPKGTARLGNSARSEALAYFEPRDRALARLRDRLQALARS